MLLYESMLNTALQKPNNVVIRFHGECITYRDLLNQVNQFARGLSTIGVVSGKTVALLLPNCPQFTVSYYSTTALGGLCVPANPLLKPKELEYIWQDSRAEVVITTSALLPNVREAISDLPWTVTIISVDCNPDSDNQLLYFNDMITGSSDTLDVSGIDDRSAAVCIYTSGTTGRPKGALLSHFNLTENCRQVTRALQFDDTDNFMCVLPLFHSFAGTVCQNTSIFVGASFTIMEQFHPTKVLETVQSAKTTIFCGVPTMYGALLQFPADQYDFSSTRLCVSGGAPMPAAVMASFEAKYKTIMIEGDGPTECGPVTSINPIDGVRKVGSVGPPLPGVQIKIFDDNNQEVPTNDLGEIVVKGDNVMIGYLNLPKETEEAFAGGWYHTGDIGKIDEDGYVFILDRKKDMLLVGGFNVYPREIEELLYTHPAVQDAAVIGMPDDLRGDQVTAVIVAKPGSAPSDHEIIKFCRANLANYKVPRKVIFRDILPKGGTGKVVKRLLKKELELEAGMS